MHTDTLASLTAEDGPAAIKACFESDGAFVMRDLFDAELIRQARASLRALLHSAGWVHAPDGEALRANLGMRCADPDLSYVRTYRRALALAVVHRLPHSESVRALAIALGINDLFVLPRLVLRLVFPGTSPTPPHQDWTTIRGSQDAATIWVPLMPCQLDDGPVAVIKASHHAGVWPRGKGRGIGGEIVLAGDSAVWSAAELDVGDAVVFRALTVHRALPNVTDRMRLSMDFRIQDMAQPIHPGSLLPPDRFRSWDEVYRSWRDPDLDFAHYWRGRHPRADPSVAGSRAEREDDSHRPAAGAPHSSAHRDDERRMTR
jgi:ectoine hydroxylase-related dioxygenase (phytanoyl-CoA dioxygenase family)